MLMKPVWWIVLQYVSADVGQLQEAWTLIKLLIVSYTYHISHLVKIIKMEAVLMGTGIKKLKHGSEM
jgi:hypothetical protein